ncbi:MAG: hypothetical protein KGM16_00820 [Bacteroidota bacterium]|nr:hypothetical protein [Bacteroidota bacterium]
MGGSSVNLPEFYEAIANDVRIGPTHICLYVALLNEWVMACANDAIVPERNVLMKKDSIPLDRNVLMKNARISRRTYHKCMRELHEYGYIRYEPSSNPCLRSRVYLKRL